MNSPETRITGQEVVITLSTDQNKKPLTELGKLIVSKCDEVMRKWEARVREQVPGAEKLPMPILVNTLPSFIENIAQAVSANHPRPIATMYNSLATEHGGERARMTGYSHEHLIREYQILRWVLLDTIKEAGADITAPEIFVIHASIDEAIQEAATTFSLVLAELRTTYIATLSHDMKTPLGAIGMSADRIIRKSDDLQSVLRHAAKIKNNVNRITKMIDDLLDVTSLKTSGKLKIKPERCDIRNIVEEVIDELESKNLERIKLNSESLIGYWDKNYIRRAVENLVGNAIKYGEPGTPITISTAEKLERMTLFVHNVGKPIPIEERQEIFLVFRRAQEAKLGSEKGWGLGLPLVRAVAEAHGGSIVLDSTADEGNTFIIDIPVDARPFLDAPVT